MPAPWRKFCGLERKKIVYQSDLSPTNAVQCPELISQALIGLESERTGQSHSVEMTQSAGFPGYSPGDFRITFVPFAGSKLVFQMGWLAGSFCACEPSNQEAGRGPGDAEGDHSPASPPDGSTLSVPGKEGRKSQTRCRSAMMGHQPRRGGQQGLGKEDVWCVRAAAWAAEPPRVPSPQGAAGEPCRARSQGSEQCVVNSLPHKQPG